MLRYAPSSCSTAKSSIQVLVICDGRSLQIHTNRGWEHLLEPIEKEYLSELIAEWKLAAEEQIPDVFASLSELSVGPLIAVQSGSAGAAECLSLIRTVEAGSQ
jgi:hypothetical protein